MCTDLLPFVPRMLTSTFHRQGWKSIFAKKRAQASKSRLVWFGHARSTHSQQRPNQAAEDPIAFSTAQNTHRVSRPHTQQSQPRRISARRQTRHEALKTVPWELRLVAEYGRLPARSVAIFCQPSPFRLEISGVAPALGDCPDDPRRLRPPERACPAIGKE